MENFNARERTLENLKKAKERGNIGVYKYVQQRFDRFNGKKYKRLDRNASSEKHDLLVKAFLAMDLDRNIEVVARFVTDFVIPYFKENDLHIAILESNYIGPIKEHDIIAHSYIMNVLEEGQQTPETSVIDTAFNIIINLSRGNIEPIGFVPYQLRDTCTTRSNTIINELKAKRSERTERMCSSLSKQGAQQLIDDILCKLPATEADPNNAIIIGYTAVKAINFGLGNCFIDYMSKMDPSLAQVFGDTLLNDIDNKKDMLAIINNMPSIENVNPLALNVYAKQNKQSEATFGSMQDVYKVANSITK